MKLGKQVLKVAALSLMGLGLVGGAAMTAQASTTYHRTATVKTANTAYYSTSQTGKTYKFVGSTKKFTFKANHALKNYTSTTWHSTKKTTVTKAGKKYTYYYVTNTKNKAQGWVWSGFVKKGTNPTTNVKTAYSAAKTKHNLSTIIDSARALNSTATLKTNSKLQTIANTRAKQLTTKFSTNYAGKAAAKTLASQVKVSLAKEVYLKVAVRDNNAQNAVAIFNEMSTSQRQAVLAGSKKQAGMGLVKKGNQIYVAIELAK
ncbi:hypothetical protein [Lactiplantibacillus fabifermentans]|uniref:D-alanyl-D-alanine carboxypeptidase n=2 Tax=Lactiplantibacillus fabifermentans TaxID=483011 RepID=A0A0R2NRR7_9LACO|nr:hypothetical protein [Lactiplantibacillus fabifermentans]ETY73813.1 D-alanyl-D-alanine carboxypeptidase [Lactiplantibacillus fabifermentans T30PCM01]KRO27570.1 hypothetical protein DY78_GL003088 [Lactiplantibacillus fabifermentans DSM 21115]